jgi:ankyrin repeat protein
MTLHEAAAVGDLASLSSLLAAGSDSGARDRAGWTPLLHAANAGHAAAIQLLLAAGAELEVKAPQGGSTPLMLASALGHRESVVALLCAGADPWLRNDCHKDAHTYAREGSHEAVALLLSECQLRANRAAESSRLVREEEERLRAEVAETAAVALAAERAAKLLAAAKAGDAQALSSVLSAGVDVNTTDRFGQTALITAAYRGDAASVRLLLAAGADASLRNSAMKTAHAYATDRGHKEVVALLS